MCFKRECLVGLSSIRMEIEQCGYYKIIPYSNLESIFNDLMYRCIENNGESLIKLKVCLE